MTAVEAATPVDVVGQLLLPGFTLSEVGVQVTGPIALDSIASHLASFRRIEGVWSWWVGDYVLAVEAEHGMVVANAKCAESGLNQGHVTRCVGVAEAVPLARRRAGLTWTHHELVARMSDDDQDRWLDRAEEAGWSWQEMRTAILKHVQKELPGVSDWVPVTPNPRAIQQLVTAAGDPNVVIAYQPGTGRVWPLNAVPADMIERAS